MLNIRLTGSVLLRAIRLALPLVCLCYSFLSEANILTASATISVGENIRGQDIANDHATLAANIDWFGQSGLLIGGRCFTSAGDVSSGLQEGCRLTLGYFQEVGENQAVELQVRDWTFTEDPGRSRDFTEYGAQWFLSKQSSVSIALSDNWMGRGFSSLTLDGFISRDLTDFLTLDLSAGLMKLQSSAPVDNIPIAKIGLNYELRRWSFEFEGTVTDRNKLSRMTGLNVDQPELRLSLRYRLY